MSHFHFHGSRPTAGLPDQMRGVTLLGHGGFDQLAYRTDLKTPHAGPKDVIVRVQAASINNTDINMRMGWYSKSVQSGTDRPVDQPAVAIATDTGWGGESMTFPRIQGADAVGYIVDAGAEVDPKRIGERVIIDPILRFEDGHVGYFGSDCDGGFSEYTRVPAANAVKIQSALSDEELASFPCAYLAALNMIERAEFQAGEEVLVTGASGGVGLAAVDLLRLRGVHVYALMHPSKKNRLNDDPAVRIVDRLQPLSDTLGDSSMDGVIDVVGGSLFPSLLGVLKHHGRLSTAGAIAGPMVPLDLRTVYLKDLSIFGCTIPAKEVFAQLVSIIESGHLTPHISATFRLSELVVAQERFLTRSHLGKIVIKID
jgi:NADPH:quinone reductase-like Zn-dependent oxidoreductase